MVKLHCLGGCHEVGRNAFLVESKSKVMLDYGAKVETGETPMLPKTKTDALFITHGHLDHLGMAPYLHKRTHCKVYSTTPTYEFSNLLLRDALKIARIKERRAHYTPADIFSMNKDYGKVNYADEIKVGDIRVDVWDAGHVPGSAMYVVKAGGKKILYTGDFKLEATRLVNGARFDVKNVDAVVMENTYSSRDHPPRAEQEKELYKSIKETVENGGVVLLPTFAVRAPEILLILDHFGANFPVYLDGMAKDALSITLDHPEFIRNQKELHDAAENVIMLYENEERNNAMKEPCVIVTTGGAMEGGPIVHYMKNLYAREDSSIFFTGFQIPGTAGRYLEDTGRYVAGAIDFKVKMNLKKFDFSVTPDTLVLVRDAEKIKLCHIKDVPNKFDVQTLECFAFDKNTLKSKWYPVSAVIKHNYAGKLYKITTKSGRSTEITQGHSIFVIRDGKIVDVPGEEVKVGDYIVIPKRITTDEDVQKIDFSKYFQRSDLTAPKEIHVTKAICRLMGYYAAEGHSVDRLGISLNNETEQELAQEITNSITEVFPQLQVQTYYPNPSELQLRFGGTLTARIFKGFCGKGAHNKCAPDFLFQSSIENIGEFVGAYLTGDGWFDKDKLRVKSVSKKLIDDILYLLLRLGIIAKYDGVRISKERKAPQGTIFKESRSHQLRIQGLEDLRIILPYLRSKLKTDVETYLNSTAKTMTYPPKALPVRELNLKESMEDYNWRIEKILRSSSRNHISPNLIKNENITNQFLTNVLNGDVAFDLVTKSEEDNYAGEVYDLSVPGPQNFLGGTGGIFLHNSAHAGRTELIKFIQKVRPKKMVAIHGDYCGKFATEMKGRFGIDTYAPKVGDIIKI